MKTAAPPVMGSASTKLWTWKASRTRSVVRTSGGKPDPRTRPLESSSTRSEKAAARFKSCRLAMTVGPRPRIRVQNLELMPDIQVIGRFVENDEFRLLRQRAGDHHPLLFAAGQRGELTRSQTVEVHAADRRVDHRPIMRAKPGEALPIRRAAERNHFAHRETEIGGLLLQNRRHLSRHRARAQRPNDHRHRSGRCPGLA